MVDIDKNIFIWSPQERYVESRLIDLAERLVFIGHWINIQRINEKVSK